MDYSDCSSVFVEAFTALKAPLSTAFDEPHQFWCVVVSLSLASKYFISLGISSFAHWLKVLKVCSFPQLCSHELFRSGLLNF